MIDLPQIYTLTLTQCVYQKHIHAQHEIVILFANIEKCLEIIFVFIFLIKKSKFLTLDL
jgi:hypothetical protein